MDDLKQIIDTAIKAENIEVKLENIEVKLDIYLDSHSPRETDKKEEVECIDLTMDTDSNSKNSDVTVENFGSRIKKTDKAKYKINSVVLLH